MRRLNSAYGNRVHWLVALLVAALGATVAVRGAAAAVDQREMKAREAFAMGQYQEALDLFAKLYAEKLHPNYLRNIGRCYQNLGDPDKAISSFREYLRKAKAVTPDERQEVEGYIKEMEDLKAKRQTGSSTTSAGTGGTAAGSTTGSSATSGNTGGAGATTEPTSATASSTGSTTSGGVPTLNATDTTTSQQAAGADLTGGTQPAAKDDGGPIYGRWWFWAIVVGVAAAGVGVAAAAGAFTTTKNATCPMDLTCK